MPTQTFLPSRSTRNGFGTVSRQRTAVQRSGEVSGPPEGFIWKPHSQGQINGGRATSILPSSFSNNTAGVRLVDAAGNTIEDGRYRSTMGDGKAIWDFGKPGTQYPAGSRIIATTDDGQEREFSIDNPGSRYEGDRAVVGHGSTPGGFGFGGGSTDATANPFYIGDQYPTFNPISFNDVEFEGIDPADYKFTDPVEFGRRFGDFNRGEVSKNFGQAKDMALEALDLELQGLENFVPAAAAIKRSQTSVDNEFNQAQRERQVDGALPNARGDLNAQRRRALDYADGRLPNEGLDRAYELGIRSKAADAAGFSGIGPRSGEATKISDLMSAEERFRISQYGEGLFGQNLSTQANLFLAPTSYSDAGAQVRVNPEVGGGRLAMQSLGTINEATLVSPGQALSSEINQNQFKTNLEQSTNQFNASGKFSADQFNSSGQFSADQFNSAGQFAADLGKFQYDVSYLNAVQMANQSVLTNAFNAGLAEIMGTAGQNGYTTAQNAQTIQSTIQGIGAIPSAVDAITSTIQGLGLTSTPLPATNNAPAAQTSAPVSVDGGQPVGSTSVDTQPSQQLQRNAPMSEPIQGTPLAAAPTATGVDVGSPSTLKFSGVDSVPSGYAPVATNSDGSVSAANIGSYDNELNRFARAKAISSGVSVQNAALADRALSTATGISYQPVQGFQQIGLTSSGQQVYSDPRAASSGDISVGQTGMTNMGVTLATLGQTDPTLMKSIGELSGTVSNPSVIGAIDAKSQEGPTEVAKQITETFLGSKKSGDSEAHQQFSFMAARTGELWGQFSPEQKSAALQALAGPALKVKTGEDVSQRSIPGSERSFAGKLAVGDTLAITASGKNGYALARNWGQLSALGNIVGGTKGVTQIAAIGDKAGALGFGVQGASVPVESGYLKKVGARPAPSFGVGAMTFGSDATVPKNYRVVSRTPDNKPIALPGNLIRTSPFSTGNPQPLAYQKAAMISEQKHPAQKRWGKSPLENGMYRGSAGGSALVSSISQMVESNPTVAGGMIAYSMFNNMLGEQNG